MELRQDSILCVDDDPEVLDLLKEYFTQQGFVVFTASNGVEAFLQVKQWMPRAVVMDLFMPRLGGIGALARIKTFNPDVAVILISGMINALDLVTEAGLTVDGVLAKPLNLTRLSEALARVGVMPPAGRAAAEGFRQPRPIRARVLVVDDELPVRKMLSEHLRAVGYDVLEVADGQEALARMPEYRPNIMLLDLMMAGMDGLETRRRAKAMAPETCVIMVTAVEDMQSAQTALGRGASDYVTKPFSFQYLDSVLEVHLLVDRIDPDSK